MTNNSSKPPMSSTPSSQSALTEGSVVKHLYRMTIPMVWALLANFSVQFVDLWFIAQLGKDELTAMGFAFPVIMIVFSLAIGLSAGAASVVARKAPVYNQQQMRELISDSQMLSLMIATSVSMIGLLTIDPVFIAIGADERLLPLIRDYMQIFYFNSIITTVAMQALSSVRALGDSRAQASSMIAAAVINLILDPIFIFGYFGFPRLELQGAALASTLARLASLVIAYKVLIQHKDLFQAPSFNWPRLKKSWGQVLHIALPAAGTNMIIPLSGAIITAILASFGEYAVAGMGIASRIEPLLLIFFFSLSAIISPFAGQNLGALQLQRIYQGVKYACIFSMLFGLVMALAMWLFAPYLVGLFAESEKITQVAIHYLYIVPISYGAAGVVMIINASFNGIAKPLAATSVSLLRVIILYLPLAYIGAKLYGINGIFIAYSAVNIICAGIGYIWFIKTAKQVCEEKQQKRHD